MSTIKKGAIQVSTAPKYEIDGKEAKIMWNEGNLSINDRERKTIGATPLPDNVLIYYLGHNDTVAGLA